MEEVCDFPLWLLEAEVSDVYDVYPLYSSPAQAGFRLIARDRLYVVMVHRARACLRFDLYDVFERMTTALMERDCTQVSDAYIASPAE
eukprot:11838414-Alexandrium_andersonii.AAC.1